MRAFSPQALLNGILALIIAAVLIIMGKGMVDFSRQAEAEQLAAAKSLVERAIIQCYALEGAYPPDLDYLKNYGVAPNYDKYVYVYDVIGANVLPIVEVKFRQ